MSSLDDEKALNNVQNVIALSRHFIDSIVNSEPVFPPFDFVSQDFFYLFFLFQFLGD